ncbi:leucine-rich repeat, immunoglobulin-like domain and transmembrane domain-containing protein 3 [Solea senegalensis]|nr:leucine-rich repeat, immunoglobulin-like domain and transmembrane domain-containing protein 3 [Solea senegalensis]
MSKRPRLSGAQGRKKRKEEEEKCDKDRDALLIFLNPGPDITASTASTDPPVASTSEEPIDAASVIWAAPVDPADRRTAQDMQVSQVGVCWSIISLNGLSYKDAGEYRCQARNGAGASEALIKLKVEGVTRLSRLPKKKSQKTKLKPLFKNKNLNPNPAPVSTPIGKKKEMLQNITPPSFNKTQTVLHVVSKGLPIDETIK